MATDEDKSIGENVARLRGDRSQQLVADEMRSRGYDWSQATVWSVEKGRRPLRFAEAAQLADILDVTVTDLLPEEKFRGRRDLMRALGDLAKSKSQLYENAARYTVQRAEAQRLLAELELEPGDVAAPWFTTGLQMIELNAAEHAELALEMPDMFLREAGHGQHSEA